MKLLKKKIFIKLAPILDVLPYLMNHYSTDHKLSNIFSFITNNKINSYNNTAYIDSFSSFVLSRLSEKGLCPTFPMFYGTFSGISKLFDFDITEEYNSIKNCKWFKNKINKEIKKREEKRKGLFLDSESINSSDCESLKCEELNIDIDILDTNNIDDNAENKETDEENINDDEKNSDNEEDSDNKENSDNEEDSEWEDCSETSDISINESLSDNLEELDDYKNLYYSQLKNYPVQMNIMELCDNTLDELIERDDYEITSDEWKSILFQVCFGMAVAQKQYNFVHNDLHSSNIMFSNTEKEYLYIRYKNYYYKIPTFGKITKIIDFGRATFKINDKLFFSDVFKKYGDAEGQYCYPYNNSLKKCKILPNKSFDLARLATTIFEYFEEDQELYDLMKSWATDKYGNCLIYCEDDFDLYRNIAKNVFNSIPKDQLNKKIFRCFRVLREDIPENEYIYVY